MKKAIRFRVMSSDEAVSIKFCIRVLEYMGNEQSRSIRPIIISTNKFSIQGIDFSDITRWSFDNAVDNLEELVRQGNNTIILSEDFCEWKSKKEFINEDLYRFEDLLEKKGVNVITVESYFTKSIEIRQRFFINFNKVNKTYSSTIEEIIHIMVSDYRDTSLISPLSCSPYFMLNPEIDEKTIIEGNLTAYVGFQAMEISVLYFNLK